MQTLFPFTEAGIADAIAAAIEMRSVKSTIVPAPKLAETIDARFGVCHYLRAP